MSHFTDDDFDNDNLLVVLSGRADHSPSPIEGSFRVTARCNHEVWISPAMYPTYSAPGGTAICTECAADDPKIQASMREHGLVYTAAQRAELNKKLGVSRVDQIIAKLKIKEFDTVNFKVKDEEEF